MIMENSKYKIGDIRLYESLFILFKCNQTVGKTWELYQKNRGNNFLLFHMILEVENFMEEYKGYFNCKNIPQYKERINQIRYITKPIFKEINKWKLRDFRNNIIAHPWRDEGEFILPDSEKYKAPKNEFEFLLLKNYLNYIWSLIADEFEKEDLKAQEYMCHLSGTTRRKRNFSSINEIQQNLVKDVNSRCKKYDKDYYLKIELYKFED